MILSQKGNRRNCRSRHRDFNEFFFGLRLKKSMQTSPIDQFAK